MEILQNKNSNFLEFLSKEVTFHQSTTASTISLD